MPDKKTVFQQLHAVDVKPYVKWSDAEDSSGTTIKLPYLPWQHAHALMMEHFPQYEWNFRESPQGLEVFYFADGTAEVSVLISIDDITTYASKSVTGIGNRAVKNPNADDIHNAKMRCRVRALAELGLGFDLWTNPDNYPYIPIVTEVSNSVEGNVPSKPKNDTVSQKDKSKKESKEEFFERVLEQATSEKVAKTIKPRARRSWGNRKWSLDDFDQRWDELCKAQGWNIK